MRRARFVVALLIAGFPAISQARDGVIARCGASLGHAYYLKDAVTNPDGPMWTEDGMRNGKIVLIKLGEEWDIQFDDSLGASGYRQDGAEVFPLTSTDNLLVVGAFHPNYSDIYMFDFVNHEVAWTSTKVGPITARAAAYRAPCD